MAKDKARELAELLEELDRENECFAEARDEHKKCTQKIRTSIHVLQKEIVTGQKRIGEDDEIVTATITAETAKTIRQVAKKLKKLGPKPKTKAASAGAN